MKIFGQKLPTVPRYAQYRIYWNEEGGGAAFILVGYCPDTFPYFAALVKKAQETFPDLDLEDVICGKVTKSDCIKGFTLITFPVEGQRRKIKGWEDYGYYKIDFCY